MSLFTIKLNITYTAIKEHEYTKMNKAQKLQIRINFVVQADNAAKAENDYIYHWQRIIGASLLFSSAVAVLVGSGFHYLNQPDQPTQGTTIAIATTPQSTVKEIPIAIQSLNKTAILPSDNNCLLI